jgi:hypothetical protein
VIADAAVLPYSRSAPQPENRGRYVSADNRRWNRRGV